MITHIKGDLLEWPNGINVILHCANTQNTMGSGIAKSIREKYPQAWQADCAAAKYGNNKLGYYSTAALPDKKLIVNGYCQEYYNKGGARNRHLNYEALYTVLENLHFDLKAGNQNGSNFILGLPQRMGCDRAGGDVRILNAMLQVIFGESPLQVYVVEYNGEINK